MHLLFSVSSVLFHERMLNFVKTFFHLLWWWCGFCPWFCLCAVLHLLFCVCYTFLVSLEWSLLDHGIWCFNVLLDLICKYFIEDFSIYVHQGYWLRTLVFFFFFIAVLGVLFSKNLIIYYSWIHPLHHSPLPPDPHSWNSFNKSHFSIYIHVYTVFAPHSPSFTLFPHPPPSHWYQHCIFIWFW
jgi:hypothetical protein